MRFKHLFVLSPPFYSHFMPLLSLAKSFKRLGCRVTFGCSREFEETVVSAQMDFYEIDLSANKNTGMALNTEQPESEKLRLFEFFEATKVGAVETLMTQSRHRKEDMLNNPLDLMEKIRAINSTNDVDMWLVDILSYGATLSLYCLKLPFITFCPPHPYTIPRQGEIYGVPKSWPSCIDVLDESKVALSEVALETQEQFTHIFNGFIAEHRPGAPEIENAFRLVSEEAIIYNYLDFNSEEETSTKPLQIYMGHAFEEKQLSEFWLEKVEGAAGRKILITLGTFLSNRADILEKLLCASQKFDPEALIIVAAGSNAKALEPYESPRVSIHEFIPQTALMPYMDIVIHHGGCNTFTETLYFGKPMIILPFSSDQFNIAADAERNQIAFTLNPNQLSEEAIVDALGKTIQLNPEILRHWSEWSKQRGTNYAAKCFLL